MSNFYKGISTSPKNAEQMKRLVSPKATGPQGAEVRLSNISEDTNENNNSKNFTSQEIPYFKRPTLDENQINKEELTQIISDNDIRNFKRILFSQTNLEITSIRLLDEELNVLQTICYFNADLLIDVIRERFKDDQEGTKKLIEYAEPSAGNRAINYAVLTGNQALIDFVLIEMKANAKILTSSGLNLLHGAAQIDRGALSLMYFSQKKFSLNVNQKD